MKGDSAKLQGNNINCRENFFHARCNFAARFHTIITVADETEVTRCELAALLPGAIVRDYHLNSPGTFFLSFIFLCALETIHSGLEQIICAITEC